MKTILYVLALTFMLSCQNNSPVDELNNSAVMIPQDISSTLQENFNEKYPKVDSLEWEAEEDGYEAKFFLNGKKYEADFDKATEKWVQTESDMIIADLSTAIVDALKNKYPEFTIEEASAIESAAYGDVFQVTIEQDSDVKNEDKEDNDDNENIDNEENTSETTLEIIIDGKGKILSIVKENDDDKNKESDDNDNDNDDDDDDDDE